MNVVIVGANHAGIAAANTLLDNYPEAKVTMVDRNSNLSYLGCGTALWVGRQIDRQMLQGFTDEEVKQLAEYLERLRANLEPQE